MLARPGLPDFDYLQAKTPQDVFKWMDEKGDDLKLLMGGTDLFIQMRDRGKGAAALLDLKTLPGIQDIQFDSKQGLTIGAAAALNRISEHSAVMETYPVLVQAADTVGNYQLRNRATLGGNICNASPSADTSPAALIYKGIAVLESPSGEREIDLGEFWIGPGKTDLGPNEYLKAIRFPVPPEGSKGIYLKLGRSKMGDLAIVGVAVLGYPDQGTKSGFRFRIGINSTAPTAYRVPAVEEYLANHELKEDVLLKAAEEAMNISAPIEDQRASALYQKKMVRSLVNKALNVVLESLKSS
jgi:carbon-monoxide dehydrogenase medium subunit